MTTTETARQPRGVGDGLAEDALVAQMNAVKNADGRADRARAGVQFSGGVDDLHQAGRLGLGQLQKWDDPLLQFARRTV